jgi:hypothetical protein
VGLYQRQNVAFFPRDRTLLSDEPTVAHHHKEKCTITSKKTPMEDKIRGTDRRLDPNYGTIAECSQLVLEDTKMYGMCGRLH